MVQKNTKKHPLSVFGGFVIIQYYSLGMCKLLFSVTRIGVRNNFVSKLF